MSVSSRARVGGIGLVGLVLALICAAVFSGSAAAATLRVCLSGCPYGTISDALAAAAAGDTIRIGRGTYAGGFVIDAPVTLRGAGAGKTIISGGDTVLTVETADGITTISRVTITGGSSVLGAGISNDGTLAVEKSVVTDNAGIGILNDGTVTVDRSTVSENDSGILNRGQLVVLKSAIRDNSGSFGGITSVGGSATIEKSVVSGNTSSNSGGGIAFEVGSVTLIKTLVIGNHTEEIGGGIHNFEGALTLIRSKVMFNSAAIAAGGISNDSVTPVTLVRSRVEHNTPDDCDGAGCPS
jgi:hypothetical protein